jgi:hypothetical protein
MNELANGKRDRLQSAQPEIIKAQEDETGYYHPVIRKAFSQINDLIDSDLSDVELIQPVLDAMDVQPADEHAQMLAVIFHEEILPENKTRLKPLVEEVARRLAKRELRLEDARAVDIIFAWIKNHDFSLIQKNEASRVYRLAEAMMLRQLLPSTYDRKESDLKVMAEAMMGLPSIVVRHNWTKALGNLCEKGDEIISIKLPYPTCLFEFMVHGKCVIVMASDQNAEGTSDRVRYLHFVEFEKDKWFECSETDEDMVKMFVGLREQIEAICVALDSQIADQEEVQPPVAINKKRLKAGKLPLRSHHVVDLSKRFRSKRGTSEGESTRSVRLHWRRGHWRHYTDNHRTWINWMLVGNVDLGFVDKHYLA